jgi:hypothetical protein
VVRNPASIAGAAGEDRALESIWPGSARKIHLWISRPISDNCGRTSRINFILAKCDPTPHNLPRRDRRGISRRESGLRPNGRRLKTHLCSHHDEESTTGAPQYITGQTQRLSSDIDRDDDRAATRRRALLEIPVKPLGPNPQLQRPTTTLAWAQFLPASRSPSVARLFSDLNSGPCSVRHYGLAPVASLWRLPSGLDTATLVSRPLHRSIPVSFGQTGPLGP